VGTRFWFELWLPVDARESVTPDLSGVRGSRVLIVDDNATNRMVVSRHLQAWGVHSEERASGPEALALLRARTGEGVPFDAAVLDLMMPGMDGLELARAIRADLSLAGISLVMLTSVHVQARDADALGVAARLTKPVRRSDLYNALVEALWRRGAPAGEAASAKEQPLRRARRSVRVLLVEDNAVNQRVALAMLKRFGCQVEVVETGQAAVDALAAGSFDLALMDVQLPGMDGIQATRLARAAEVARGVPPDAESVRVPIVALTAHAGKEDREECLAAGMDDWLAKPFGLDQLAGLFERWVPGAFGSEESGP
jgi:CheY-like chemotaxis protein